MPPLDGFSNNEFRTHDDLKKAAISLLRSLKPYQSSGGARVRLPLVTGTHFDDVAAQLEGYARPMWAVAILIHIELTPEENEILRPYVEGIANGVDPNHPEYWGPVVLRDQRMVEMEIISFALLAAPGNLFRLQTKEAQHNITEWLKTINGKDFPVTNWLWFRVMTNLCLIKTCGVPKEEVLDAMKADLDVLEQFYLSEGWAADGLWSDQGRQADYYSGSFAIQFSQLIYAQMAKDLDPERCKRFEDRAREFALSFWRYFDTNGAAIPFGRSLTYRFAFAGFWSAVAFSNLELPAPFNDWGVVKGLLLRHFRWWADKHDMFNADGTLTIGYTYPNYYMGEDYNSPQSPYWAMKSFLALGLHKEHPFWTTEEKPLPRCNEKPVVPVGPPMHILCNTENHHFLLSAGQFCPWPLKATEAKYGKFAYSSHFGFSVPTGILIQQIAPDSTLALSKDGCDTWRVPWKVTDHKFGIAKLHKSNAVVEEVHMLSSKWRPWRDAEIEVTTHLIAPSVRWPDWHVRIHRIQNQGQHSLNLNIVQGGFAIQGRGANLGETLPILTNTSSLTAHTDNRGFHEGALESQDGALVLSNAGASGIRCISLNPESRGEVLKPDANTNLIWQRTLIPTIKTDLEINDEVVLASAVFALSRTSDRQERYSQLDIAALWNDVPNISLGAGQHTDTEYHISIE